MQLFVKFIECLHMLAHHIAHVLRLQHFQLATKGEEQSYQFVVRDNIDSDAVLLIVVMLRGMQGFVLYR